MKNALYWVTNDLRINDNTALHLANKSENLLCVYVVDKAWFLPSNYQSKHMGVKRWNFLQACLDDFNQQLSRFDQQLYIVYGDTLSTLNNLCDQYEISRVITTKHPGTYESAILTKLGDSKPNINITAVEQFTLFTQASLPFELSSLPGSYSKFKKLVIDQALPALVPNIKKLPNMFASMPLTSSFRPDWLPEKQSDGCIDKVAFEGGESAGQLHLKNYFSSMLPSDYQNVRNNLSGWDNSSKLSTWLAHGCISARQVAQEILTFESNHGKNKSTECLFLELLWREYFQWLHFSVGSKTYQFKGLGVKSPLTSFYPERFHKWCSGNTPYSLVNACMKELSATGYLSNRGRQIVASCLVNELSVDWRYGAAWFEQNLIDYDAAVNWGNWQYISGVGTDPRGGRHFNITKQTELYDPYKEYQSLWLTSADHNTDALDSNDAVDWPVSVSS